MCLFLDRWRVGNMSKKSNVGVLKSQNDDGVQISHSTPKK